jgi:hypothetical protein
MAAGTPIWFFIVECTLLNLLFAWAAARERRCSNQLLRKLRALDSAR